MTAIGAIAAIIAAATALLGLLWRVVDWYQARPRVKLEEATLGFRGKANNTCEGLTLHFRLRNESTADDVLENAYLEVGAKRVSTVGWRTHASPPVVIGPGFPLVGSCDFGSSHKTKEGAAVQAQAVFELRRAGRTEQAVEATCR